MPKLENHLKIDKCPHCSTVNPNLPCVIEHATTADNGANARIWKMYACRSCGGVVTAYGYQHDREVVEFYPSNRTIADSLPGRLKAYLQQAMDSIFVPSGSVMLCTTAVDTMLKEKQFSIGSLYKRIDEAVKQGVLTEDMRKWAHHIRLDPNDDRHAGEPMEMPTIEDARKFIEFTKTLAELLFVLPNKIARDIQSPSTRA